MREKKIKIFIGILLALIAFASSVALIMYSKQTELSKEVENQITVYVASKDISEGKYIGAEDIATSKLPKSHADFLPLTKEEIIGRYTTVPLFTNEPFRAQKLALKKPVEIKENASFVLDVENNGTQEMFQQLSSDTISVSLSIFRNLDASLKKGDLIDIVSVFPITDQQAAYKFTAKYIALNLKISSFRRNAKEMQKIMSEEYDEKTKQISTTLADTVILEVSPLEIKNVLSMYYMIQELNTQRIYTTADNRGHLWMVKCSGEENKEFQNDKNALMMQEKIAKTKFVAKKDKVKIFYED